MKEAYFFLGLAGLGCAVYHLGQKHIPGGANPMVVLAAAYLLACITCAVLIPFFKYPSGGESFLGWPFLALAFGAVLIEVGFLFAYRCSASLQWSGVAVNGLAALVLVPLAVWLFKEKFTLVKAAGILLTLTGMALMVKK